MGLNEILMSIAGSDKGTYILLMKADVKMPVVIGKLGVLNIQHGYYAYVGSAFGSGGLKARLGHHMKIASKPHWHIDYLRKEVNLIKIYFDQSGERLENCWAKSLEKIPEAEIPLIGFGASDCDAKSHLFYFKGEPDFSVLLTETGVGLRKEPLSKSG